MANFTTIEAEARERAGKGAARAARRAGRVPAVIYGSKQAATLITLEPKAVMRELLHAGWRSRLFEVAVGGQSVRALMREVQLHPVKDTPEHVDFQRLVPGEKIHVAVAVHFLNEATSPGLKRGGVLNVVRHTVDVHCDPDHIPERLEADLGKLDINDNVRWSDLGGIEGLSPMAADRNFVIATVAAPARGMEAPGAAAPAAAGGKAPAKPAAKKK